ncbi:MAG: cell division protein ZapB [Desulfovibrio sp.]|nr:cell division protein ZapB [Desulfovibrio sp.]
MNILEQLNARVDHLLERLGQLGAENEQLRETVQSLRESIHALEEKNSSLTNALAEEESIRATALELVGSILERIQEYDNVE